MSGIGPGAPPRLSDWIASESGGLRYHLRALSRRRAWAPFSAQVARWLAAWAPGREQLVLVGPSAGYTIPIGYLLCWRQVVALEPDPLARWLLSRRRDAAALSFARLDAIAGRAGLLGLQESWPTAAVLFCNVLGQVAAPEGASWGALLAELLGDRPWASYHDVLSTGRAPTVPTAHHVDAPPTLEALVQHFFGAGVIELVDHQTLGLGGAGPHAYVPWALSARQHHLVEWHAHTPLPPAPGAAV